MDEVRIEKVEREYCNGCGHRKRQLIRISLPYAMMPNLLCEDCKQHLLKLLS